METDININKKSWNQRAEVHFDSDFYDNESFIAGRNSLNPIELELLGDLKGKSILHLQCHFGQDTISLNRMGADSTGVDFSDNAIAKAKQLAKTTNSSSKFICCDIYSLPDHLDQEFDIVFTSYGTIGWLPDLDKWASVVSHFLKKDGVFIMADFHPVIWMMDDDFTHIKYPYFNKVRIEEAEMTYTDGAEDQLYESVSWNHDISEILNALINSGLTLNQFNEYDYSPYDCFQKTVEFEPGKFRIEPLGDKIPMVYAIKASK
ncbi:class I SAM-dependent methyltransferase [Portibacter lacus]|uniref:Type 12 methyltransferase n=1 Tax=Portibacter lacus TaxID=1099794 RepID=A0AA37WGK3_9BACT|nr:class I SAM-dependent methyltransferase [Portibacter lacus]GLR18419.1 type 12 methyltransferase [Portibacter lacus]